MTSLLSVTIANVFYAILLISFEIFHYRFLKKEETKTNAVFSKYFVYKHIYLNSKKYFYWFSFYEWTYAISFTTGIYVVIFLFANFGASETIFIVIANLLLNICANFAWVLIWGKKVKVFKKAIKEKQKIIDFKNADFNVININEKLEFNNYKFKMAWKTILKHVNKCSKKWKNKENIQLLLGELTYSFSNFLELMPNDQRIILDKKVLNKDDFVDYLANFLYSLNLQFVNRDNKNQN